MKSLTDAYTLSNGLPIPCIGFGMWQAQDGDEAISAMLEALRVGYRHIDTAQMYDNEQSVGEALRRSGVARGDVFLTSKLANREHGYKATHEAFRLSLEKLGTDYLDLFLIHWPNPKPFRDRWQQVNEETWRAFEELYADGKIRAIGISNFRQHHIDALLQTAKVAPMVNQIRLCPGDTQDELVAYCRERDILLEAYSPFGTGKIFAVQAMKAFAEKYGKTVAQICVRWSLQMGFLPLPKSVTASRIAENADVFDFELEDDDVRAIAGLTGCVDFSWDPDAVNW